MSASFPVKRATELMDQEFLARWMDREAIGENARRVLATVLDRFLSTGGPVEVAALVPHHGGVPSRAGDGATDLVRHAVAELDRSDLVLVEQDRIVLAYPFSGTPTPFSVVLDDGRTRHACCAIDALGMPALLRRPATVRSRCHHCGEPLELRVGRDGPLGGDGVMAWVGRRDDVRAKACASL